MKKQGNPTDFGREIVVGASDGDNNQKLQVLLNGFGIADKSK